MKQEEINVVGSQRPECSTPNSTARMNRYSRRTSRVMIPLAPMKDPPHSNEAPDEGLGRSLTTCAQGLAIRATPRASEVGLIPNFVVMVILSRRP